MMKFCILLIWLSLLILSAHGFNQSTLPASSVHGLSHKHYIVYMGSHSYPNPKVVKTHNHKLLSSITGSASQARKSFVHHYTRSFRGFSAMLTPEQAQTLREHNSTISVFESKVYTLQTTRSWDFMESANGDSAQGQFDRYKYDKNYDVIVGHFDSGVWPEARSFSDEGLGPVPEYWKGECETGQSFTTAHCNRKIIGARYYYRGYVRDINGYLGNVYLSPRDDFGHGSHTASTAVGAEVRGINMPGYGSATARGGAPQARLAVYKTCWHDGCSGADILRAFDDAIHDGVDVITMSLGAVSPGDYFEDAFSIGALHAFQRGITIVACAGNDGDLYRVENVAPWVLTVAASTIDREMNCFVHLGNQEIIKGYSFNWYNLGGSHDLILAGNAAYRGVNNLEASYCRRNTLNPDYIRRRIVVCAMNRKDDAVLEKSLVLYEGGAVGMILINQFDKLDELMLPSFTIPTSIISGQEGRRLYNYMAWTRRPFASMQNHVQLGVTPAPKMALFSSRGPNPITPDIIKPDITAPGVNIIAAYPPNRNLPVDALSFALYTGTSMATPHVAGVAAILKARNRGWSPAEIKSALMTTVKTTDNTGNFIRGPSGDSQATPFEMGSGHLNPDHAFDPGLVYDFNMDDLVPFLCNHGYTYYQMQAFFQKPVACNFERTPGYALNYPSIGVGAMYGPTSVYRTVTFKGAANDPKVFRAEIVCPPDVNMVVVPEVLDFSNGSTKATYRVDFYPLRFSGLNWGSITWTDGYNRRVRSPILINLGGLKP